ncbi:Esyt2 [Gossypium arboreum]|uniref:Esyt2 n=1 Tax=Gossypium arboreum TaxID=29729 RepID=A0A0B0NPB7_GOSAR|nr:Esyt2 [Gossypium arboreum]
MGVLSSVMGVFGFGIGTSVGIVIGYYMFIYFLPTDVKDPKIRPLVEEDSKTLQQLLPEIPLWVKNPDFDRVDWLNKFIETMWPYLDTRNTHYCSYYMPGMKVYVTDEKEIIMEPSLKWAGNPNIIIAVKAFGLKATVQVVDLQVFAVPRITLKPLLSVFPCFANIYVSLMDKVGNMPHVDFGLKLLGADVMAIPGLYRFVQELIKDQVANMYLWPKALQVPIMDPTQAMKKPVGMLDVKVVKAMKLRKKDFLGKSDPYVKLKLTEEKLSAKKTTVKQSNLNPEWNEEFSFVVKDPNTQALEIILYDWEQVGKHDKMGMNVVPLKDLTPEEPKVFTLDLLKNMDPNDQQNEKSRGQLVLEALYKPFKEDEIPKDVDDSTMVQKAPEGTPAGGGLLVVIVHEAEDIEGKYHTNPHVRLLFRGEERKTKRVKKSRDPRWEEEFQFMVDEPPTNDKIHIEAFSTSSRIGLLHPKESLGYVTISLADVVNNRRINEKYHLIDSKNGRIQIEMQWRTS